MIDIILYTLPCLELLSPITAPALLKSAVEEKGFKAKCIDLNIEWWHKVDNDAKNYWNESNMTLETPNLLNKFWNNHLLKLALHEIDRIKKINPRWIGINIFISKQRNLAKMFINFLKINLKNCKIVIGGNGISNLAAENWLTTKLIDCYVQSEGELPLIEILKGNFNYPGINGIKPIQLDNLDYVPIPDYRDYNLSLYSKNFKDVTDMSNLGTNTLYISGSRGCVRSCTFCDIASYWPKFRYRNGKSIAEEMIVQIERHNVKNFQFTDSLVNGAMKPYRNMCNTLINYYEEKKMKPITWGSQAIIRPKNQMTEDDWYITKKSGCQFLALGVESGSESVRTHMRKHFSNDDIDFAMKMAEKFNINLALLMIIGYPTETEKDFNDTLDLFRRYSHMKNQISVQLGKTLSIAKEHPLWEKTSELNIEFYTDNAGLTQWKIGNYDRKFRLERWIKAYELLKELEIPTNVHNVKTFQDELKDLYSGYPTMGPTSTI